MKKNNNSTYIHGIAASAVLDSSGERISIEGMDISSLPVSGVFNYEHLSNSPQVIVGKILQAKKIFSEKDCDNDAHKYFWKKVQHPFVYVAGILFDGDEINHSGAKDVASLLRYDDTLDRDKVRQMVHFSIEGSRLGKNQGEHVPACIARKVTITMLPCNHTCVAESLKQKIKETPKNLTEQARAILSKFKQDIKKTEEIAVEILKTEFLNKLKLSESESFTGPKNNPIHREGKTIVPKRTFRPNEVESHTRLKAGDRIQHMPKKPRMGANIYHDPNTWKSDRYSSNMRKAIAKSCAPSSLVGDAALAKEYISKEKVLKHLAEEAWANFDKKEELIEFIMKKEKEVNLNDTFDAEVWAKEYIRIREGSDIKWNADEEDTMRGWFANAIMAGYDHARRMTKSEATAIAKTYAYIQQLKLEKKLEDIVKGERGDWKKERYTIHSMHFQPGDHQGWADFHQANDGLKDPMSTAEEFSPHTKKKGDLDDNSFHSSRDFHAAVEAGTHEHSNMHPFVYAKDRAGKVVGGLLADGASSEVMLSKVHPQHRRKGIASALYAHMEGLTGKRIEPGGSQTKDAEKLWTQKARPFGKSEEE